MDTLGCEDTSGGITVAKIVSRVPGSLQPGEIVLMHCGSNPSKQSTLDADALGYGAAALGAGAAGTGLAADRAAGGYRMPKSNGGVANYNAPWCGSLNGGYPRRPGRYRDRWRVAVW
jgi:hypothetical protein